MKQKLFLGISTQLKMTPQLQQAIKLLQLSTLELQQEIQENLYSNPLLEIDEDASVNTPDDNQTAHETADVPVDMSEAMDTEYFSMRKTGNQPQMEDLSNIEQTTGQGLHDYLSWQLRLSHVSERDLLIGEAIIDSIDNDGLLQASQEELSDAAALEEPAEEDEIEAMLHRIQHFDPPGVGARNLRECLLIQLQLLGNEPGYSDDPVLETAIKIVDKFLPLVSQGDLGILMKQSRSSEESIMLALELLKSLNPRPGAQYAETTADYIVPDVLLTKVKGQWAVSLNPETLPKIKLTEQYTEFVNLSSDKDQQYLKGKYQEARWFLRSLESRHDTLLKVAKSIVTNQIEFFEKGPEYMRPLVLRDLAEELDFHESTISRATNQKYLSCPAGIYELKYFFSSQVSTTSGGEASSTAIKALIQKLVREENPQKPYSDSKLASMLKNEGIVVARRTVAKYREMQGIESSSARKRIN
ncbi:MAG: RNA polymerase factor sigma-54 [Pseudomonadales bacterium]